MGKCLMRGSSFFSADNSKKLLIYQLDIIKKQQREVITVFQKMKN